MIGQVRAAHPSITLNGQDYYNKLAPYFVTLTYTDNCDGKKADDLEIELSDRDMKFITTWAPQKGTFLDIGIITERWFAPIASDLSLDCGRFWIDSVEFQLPDQKVHIKATSIPSNVRIKGSNESRGWEKTSLKDIATQIAGENGMSVDWQAQNNPRYLRTEQHDESGLAFLMKRCNNAKLAIKVHRNKVVVYDEQQLEEAAPKFTLLYGNTPAAAGGACYRMAGGTFSSTIADVAKKVKVKHTSVETGETSEGEAEDEEDGGGGNGNGGNGAGTEDDEGFDPDDVIPPVLDQNVNEDTDSDDDGASTSAEGRAEAGSIYGWDAADSTKAKSVLRDKNKHKFKGTINLSLGNPLIAAGMTFTLKGVGQYDGKWFIEAAHHEVGPEYNTELTVRRCLKGY